MDHPDFARRPRCDGNGSCGRVSGLVARRHSAGPDGIRGTATGQMDELAMARIISLASAEPGLTGSPSLMSPSKAGAGIMLGAVPLMPLERQSCDIPLSGWSLPKGRARSWEQAATLTDLRVSNCFSQGLGVTFFRKPVPTIARAPGICLASIAKNCASICVRFRSLHAAMGLQRFDTPFAQSPFDKRSWRCTGRVWEKFSNDWKEAIFRIRRAKDTRRQSSLI